MVVTCGVVVATGDMMANVIRVVLKCGSCKRF